MEQENLEPNDFDIDSNETIPGEEIAQEEMPLTPGEQGQLEALGAIEEEVATEPLLEELLVTDPIQLIPLAIANNRLLQIMYMNKKGETKLYVIEPYEVGGNHSHPSGYLWGYDRNASTIKSFYLSNLLDIQLLEETFIARG